MKKSILALSAAIVMALAATSASAQTIQRVPDPTPTGTFSDDDGHAGYGEIRDDGVRACNEDPTATPAGDSLTGYAWIDTGGDGNAGNNDDDGAPGTPGITYGNGTIGAGDYDGEGTADEDANNNGQLDTEDANGNGVLDLGEDADGDGQIDTEDTNGNGKLDVDNADCPGENAP